MKTKKILIIAWVVALVIAPVAAFGQIDPTDNPLGFITSDGTPASTVMYTSTSDFAGVIVNLVNWFAWFISVAAVAMGLYAGFLFMTARGETAQLATAKKTMLYAVIGIAVAIVSFSIIAITKIFL